MSDYKPLSNTEIKDIESKCLVKYPKDNFFSSVTIDFKHNYAEINDYVWMKITNMCRKYINSADIISFKVIADIIHGYFNPDSYELYGDNCDHRLFLLLKK